MTASTCSCFDRLLATRAAAHVAPVFNLCNRGKQASNVLQVYQPGRGAGFLSDKHGLRATLFE
jgi:hypothetical protein